MPEECNSENCKNCIATYLGNPTNVSNLCSVPISHGNLLSGNKATIAETALLV